ncbi:MAG: CpsB/CapC family capsule biosynthesis tyrosine phosphatase [Clostridia bacterium]|nr:CpsB/CapC family capsule biosynthesis tyrosine phosphatase [Clostridia bacterium]
MIDIHCHVIPGIDDGAYDMGEAMEMLREANEAGFAEIIATPHTSSSKRDPRTQSIKARLAELLARASEDQTASRVRVTAGAEIMLDPDTLPLLEAGELPTWGAGRKHVLVEFPMIAIPPYAEGCIFGLSAQGYTPVLAHPERNHELSQKLDVILRFIQMGAAMQIDAGSLAGAYGPIARESAMMVVRHRMCHFIASDAHHPGNISRVMNRAQSEVSKILEAEDTEALFGGNARSVMAGERVSYPAPIPASERETRRTRGRGLFSFGRR